MSLVSVESIKTPKLEVSPPRWIWVTVGSALVLLFAALCLIPIDTFAVKAPVIGVYGILLLILLKKMRNRNRWVTMQVNRDGIYFQTDTTDYYFYVPWRCIGGIEKAASPLSSRALKIEIVGEYRRSIRNNDFIKHVMSDRDRTFVYALPRLNDRDKLIEKMDYLRRPIFQY